MDSRGDKNYRFSEFVRSIVLWKQFLIEQLLAFFSFITMVIGSYGEQMNESTLWTFCQHLLMIVEIIMVQILTQ